MNRKLKDILKKNTTLYLIRLYFLQKKELKIESRLKNFSIDERKKYISALYRQKVGEEMNWNSPRKYTEKIQISKLYDSNPLKTLCADKYAVRQWVIDRIGQNYLIPLIGVWDNVKDIDFNSLPNRFVLKVTNGSGTNEIIKDKTKCDLRRIKGELNYWMNVDFSYVKGFELHYSRITPRIIAESFIESGGEDLPDYKFLCFDGVVYYCWVDIGRYHHHKRNVYDINWKLQPWNQRSYGNGPDLEKPENFGEMVEVAEKLSKGFSHVRVDLYNVKGKIYFGEMTFTNGSGFEAIEPTKYNELLGDLWDISKFYPPKH